MKPATVLPIVALLNSRAFGKPLAVDASVSFGLEGREDICKVVEVGIKIYEHTPPDYKAEMMFSLLAGTTAWGTCHAIMPENADAQRRCSGVGVAVSSLVGSVAIGVVNYRNKEESDTVITKRHVALASFFEADLLRRGAVYEDIITVSLAARDGDVGNNGTSVQILGLRNEDGTVSNQHFHFGDDGTGTASFTPRSQHQRDLSKRGGGTAFKLSYKFIKNSESKIEEEGTKHLADAIGRDWEDRVTQTHEIGSYFGKAEFGKEHVMAFRVVPTETDSDTAFADVNRCGEIKP